MATWPSGKAGACKALITGSNPVVASEKNSTQSGAVFDSWNFVILLLQFSTYIRLAAGFIRSSTAR
jgi:hypothetical protein